LKTSPAFGHITGNELGNALPFLVQSRNKQKRRMIEIEKKRGVRDREDKEQVGTKRDL